MFCLSTNRLAVCTIIVIIISLCVLSDEIRNTLDNPNQDPLILTPLILSNRIEEAKFKSEVKFPEFNGIKSYAGYLTVNKRYNSNLFFWFFPSESDYLNAPVLLWLQGGPGESSLMGLFVENGPFIIDSASKLAIRSLRWTKKFSIIYVDNPVGTGFSFTSDDGYAKNQTIIGDQLYNAILQFFDLFPELSKNRFFITGESYAGKYAPALAYTILKKNEGGEKKIHLDGIAIGGTYSDPINQFDYSDYFYQIGLIDFKVKQQMKEMENHAIKLIENKEWVAAANIFGDLIYEARNNTLFQNATGFIEPFNYLRLKDDSLKYYLNYIQRDDVKIAINVGNCTFNNAVLVDKYLTEDFIQSVAPWISELLSHYRIMFYSGQVDMIVPYPTITNFLRKLNFSSANEYKNNDRRFWYVNKELAGYIKQAGNLTEVFVRKAGHILPRDQPEWAFDIITKFVYNQFT